MNKNFILNVINRYYLGGEVESVVMKVENGNLNFRFINVSKNMIGEMSVNNFLDSGNYEIGILQTTQLLKLISILKDEFSFDIMTVGDKAISIQMHNSEYSINYALADLSVIPKTSWLKQVPEFQSRININDEFIDRYIKGKNAIVNSTSFSIVNGGKFIIGNPLANNTNITIPVSFEYMKIDKSISFSANALKEILLANKGANTFILNISNEGLIEILIESDAVKCSYYLAEIVGEY